MSAAEQISPTAPITLKVTNNGIKAEFHGRRGQKIYKNIGLGSLARILNKDSEFDSGFLPVYGRHYIAIKRYVKMGDKEIIFIEASPANRDTKYSGISGGEVKNVRYPGLLMSVACRVNSDGTLSPRDTRLFATCGPILRDTDQLYKFPFGNVSDSNGSICWGGIDVFRGIKNLTQAGSLLDTFLYNRMNDDLYRNRDGHNLRDKLASLKDAVEYPYDTLTKDFVFRDLLSLLKGRSVG